MPRTEPGPDPAELGLSASPHAEEATVDPETPLDPGSIPDRRTQNGQSEKEHVSRSGRTTDSDADTDTESEGGIGRPLLQGKQRRSGCWCTQCCWATWCCGLYSSRRESGDSMAPGSTQGSREASGTGALLRSVGLMFAWYFFSMALSLYNKFLIGEKHGHFPAPLLMTTFHFLLQYFISSFLITCVCPSWAPSTRLSCRDYNLRIVPTALATALDIGLSNLSLAFITLTFYTMCKSSAPVFLLLFAFLFRLEALSCRLFGVMSVISIGVLFTVAGETQFKLVGFLLVMSASITSGLRWVLIQVLLQKDKLGLTNPLVTLAYLTPVMALVCACFSLLHEPWNMLHKSPFFDTWPHAVRSLLIMVLGGLIAFFMILAEFLLVLETSAVTFSVAGTVKEGATILVSHLVFGDRFTKVNLIGIFVILLGVSLFNIYRQSKHGHGPREVKQVLSSGRVADDMTSEDKQQLLSPHSAPSDALPLQSPRVAVTVSSALPLLASSQEDTARVLVATSMETPSQQQRILSPGAPGQYSSSLEQRLNLSNVSSPASPTIRNVELMQRNAHSPVQSDRRTERAHDGHGE